MSWRHLTASEAGELFRACSGDAITVAEEHSVRVAKRAFEAARWEEEHGRPADWDAVDVAVREMERLLAEPYPESIRLACVLPPPAANDDGEVAAG